MIFNRVNYILECDSHITEVFVRILTENILQEYLIGVRFNCAIFLVLESSIRLDNAVGVIFVYQSNLPGVSQHNGTI